MALRVLILHGPNLNLLDGGHSLAQLDQDLTGRAQKQGAEVKTFQANSEGALVDRLHAERGWFDVVIVNPSSLAPIAYALADALELLGKPAIEVQLEHESKGRGRSTLRQVVEKQFHGKGVAGYLQALDAALPLPVKRGEGGGEGPTPSPSPSPRAGKTIGRRPPDSNPPQPATAGNPITRALVRAKLSDRLAGKLSPEACASWARAQWSAVQNGAPVEPGQQELLEEVLLMMSASATASDHQLLTSLAKLEP